MTLVYETGADLGAGGGMVFVAMALATADAATSGASTDITSLVGLVNYGVLGVLTLGFIRGWVVSPKERDRLTADLEREREINATKEAEIKRLNEVIQNNLQAMTVTMDKQLDLAAARAQAEERASRNQSREDTPR
jgi:hypothetical protein